MSNMDKQWEWRQQSYFSYWFPALVKVGVPVPKTEIIRLPHGLCSEVDALMRFATDGLKRRAAKIGYPLFLRTGHTSNKHQWSESCYVKSEDDLLSHVRNITEFSECADMMGLPTDEWVLREFIPLRSTFTAFKDFPVSSERRFFIRDGKVECSHFYWPEAVFADSEYWRPLPNDWRDLLRELRELSETAIGELTAPSEAISRELPGYWSLDWSLGENGVWYATDMARGEASYHDEPCDAKEPTV